MTTPRKPAAPKLAEARVREIFAEEIAAHEARLKVRKQQQAQAAGRQIGEVFAKLGKQLADRAIEAGPTIEGEVQ